MDATAASIAVALVASIAPTIAALAGWRSLSKKSDQIHVLVNSNLTEVKANLAHALAEIQALKKQRAKR